MKEKLFRYLFILLLASRWAVRRRPPAAQLPGPGKRAFLPVVNKRSLVLLPITIVPRSGRLQQHFEQLRRRSLRYTFAH